MSLLCAGSDTRSFNLRVLAYHITIETRMAASPPIILIVFVRPNSPARCAEKLTLPLIYHESYMPRPYNQVTRLRGNYTLKLRNTRKDFERGRICVSQPGSG